MRQNQRPLLFFVQPPFDEGQVQILVASVDFIADDGMAEVGEVNADLMLAARLWPQAKQGKMLAVSCFAG